MHRRHRPLAFTLACLAAAVTLVVGAPASHAAHIFIDAGHGGRDPGAVNHALGVYEKTVNLQIALRLRAELESRGHRVTMSRTSDSTTFGTSDRPTWNGNSAADTLAFAKDGLTLPASTKDGLQERCDLANASGADLFISIHNNSSTSTSATGYETYSTQEDRLGALLAEHVHEEVVASVPLADRGAKTASFYVIRWSHMPAMLAECGFMSNASDLAYIRSATGQATFARAMADGVDAFLATDPFTQYWPRIAGADRYATAAELARDGWPDGAGTVLLATGENWPDALTSAPLSRKLDAPLLLTAAASLPSETAAAVARLKPTDIVVLGGENAISEQVIAAAAAAAGPAPARVRRIGGATRYETAALVAEEVEIPSGGQVIIVSGELPADAVSISAYAGAHSIPILLARAAELPTETAGFRSGREVEWQSTTIIGGVNAIGDVVAADLPKPSRIAGTNRYATNVAVLEQLYPAGGVYYVANGDAYPDCLTAGARAAKDSGAIMLIRPRNLGNEHRLYIENHEALLSSIRMVGGTTVLPYLHDWMIHKALQ